MMAAPMEGEAQPTQQRPSDVSSAAYPRWVMFRQDLKIELQGSGATETMAAARTSTGHLIQVSLRLEKPPGLSRVCLQIPHNGLHSEFSRVVAAHGDSMLIEVSIRTDASRRSDDYFVYSAGAATEDIPRPPSMSLLPSYHVGCTAGLVRRGEDLVVAARLESVSARSDTPGLMWDPDLMVYRESVSAGPGTSELMGEADLVAHLESVSAGPDTPELMREADVSLFRSGEWSVKRVQIRFRDASEVLEKIPSLWDAVVPVGDGLLCWVEYSYHFGIVFGDVFEETPSLQQYLRLPWANICGERSNRNVCATAGGDTLRFINIFPRCCCGGAGASKCQRSCHAYTIETWTMRIGNDNMEWVKDAIVDSSELWALDSYKGLRCFPFTHPVMSLDEPEVICFWLHQPPVDGYMYYDRTVDVVMVKMRSKTIHSVSSGDDGLLLLSEATRDCLIPSNVSCFFYSYQCIGSDATFRGQRQEDIDKPPPVIRDDIASNPAMLSSEPSVQASEIFEVFQEIPSYVLHDDEVKAYRILRRDNCRGFRSLLRLPKNLRKDWLLMEMKASED